MKTLIIEVIDPKRMGELTTVSKYFGDAPDILALGAGDIPGQFNKAYQTDEKIAVNLVPAITRLILDEAYEIVLLSATTVGSEIAGPVAAGIGAALISEVIGIEDNHTVIRPMYGGKAVGKYKIDKYPVILTIRRKYFEPAELSGVTPSTKLGIEKQSIRLISEKPQKSEGIPLEDADIIVSGGRGIGVSENFAMLKAMSDVLGGAVGASRGAVDEGWALPTQQIGQTGNIVAPSVYVAVGISGASQHLAGIANAKCVVAINKDEEANIFKRARFGIVCDYRTIVPVLTEVLREER
jgi:electron transfer flavoprotein alpha subunit